jgi:hypothetical protein
MPANRTDTIRAAILLSACVLGACFDPNTLSAAEHPWQLRIDREGVKAYTRKVDDSVILEFKGVVVVDAPLSQVIPVFEDVKKTRDWFYQCTASEIVEDEAGQPKVVHVVLHLPWPVSERDCVFQMSKSVDKVAGALNYALVALPDRLPRRGGMVRVRYLKAAWHFVALPDGKTEITFQQHSDPGGFVPAFISNTQVVNMPFYTLRNLRALVSSAKTHG